jgi:D-serine deaminase-like pyridoxal phosphate-dependent protein
MMLQSGIRQFKCATIAEAEMLGQAGAPDVLLAYQPTGPKLQRFIHLMSKYPATRFGCLTDHPAVAQEQSAGFAAAGLQVDVYIDLNVGMNRTGIVPGEDAMALAHLVQGIPGLNFRGLHAYDGHIRQAVFAEKEAACQETYAQALALKGKMESAGLPDPELIMGGSPSFSVHCKRPDLVCSPGTFIYWDHGYSQLCPEQAFLPAAVLVTRVISLPTPTRVTTDLGHKSVAAENEISKRVYFLNATGLQTVGQSEEHLVLETEAGHAWQPGDVLYGLPYHICPTVALYDSVWVAEGGMITGSWQNVARNRSIGC